MKSVVPLACLVFLGCTTEAGPGDPCVDGTKCADGLACKYVEGSFKSLYCTQSCSVHLGADPPIPPEADCTLFADPECVPSSPNFFGNGFCMEKSP
jgi:hypothetical protein